MVGLIITTEVCLVQKGHAAKSEVHITIIHKCIEAVQSAIKNIEPVAKHVFFTERVLLFRKKIWKIRPIHSFCLASGSRTYPYTCTVDVHALLFILQYTYDTKYYGNSRQ